MLMNNQTWTPLAKRGDSESLLLQKAGEGRLRERSSKGCALRVHPLQSGLVISIFGVASTVGAIVETGHSSRGGQRAPARIIMFALRRCAAVASCPRVDSWCLIASFSSANSSSFSSSWIRGEPVRANNWDLPFHFELSLSLQRSELYWYERVVTPGQHGRQPRFPRLHAAILPVAHSCTAFQLRTALAFESVPARAQPITPSRRPKALSTRLFSS